MPDYRRTALSIYPLRAEDQRWLLEMLPEVHRIQIDRLLQELESLGIPKLRFDLTTVSSEAVSPQPELKLPEEELLLLDNAEASEVIEFLTNEPAAVIVAFLSMYQWQWRQEVTGHFSRSRRDYLLALQELGRDSEIPDHMGRSIAQAFARILRAQRTRQLRDAKTTNSKVYKPRKNGLNKVWRRLWPA